MGQGSIIPPFRDREVLGKATNWPEITQNMSWQNAYLKSSSCLQLELILGIWSILLSSQLISIETKVELVLKIGYQQDKSGIWTFHLVISSWEIPFCFILVTFLGGGSSLGNQVWDRSYFFKMRPNNRPPLPSLFPKSLPKDWARGRNLPAECLETLASCNWSCLCLDHLHFWEMMAWQMEGLCDFCKQGQNQQQQPSGRRRGEGSTSKVLLLLLL